MRLFYSGDNREAKAGEHGAAKPAEKKPEHGGH